MADVTLTAAVRSNLLSLQGTQSLLDQAQLRLASGKKVNSALDNASAFFASQSLTNRAGDLSNLLDGIGQGIETIKAANNTITSLTSLLNQAQAIAQDARDAVTAGGSNGAFTAAGTGTFSSADATDLVAASTVAEDDTLTINFGGTDGSYSVVIGADDSLQDVVDKINAQSQAAGIGDVAKIATNADFSFRIDLTSNNTIDFGTDGDGVAAALGLTAIAQGDLPAAAGGLAQKQQDYNDVITQINGLIPDGNYRGTNLLNNNDLKVRFNEDGSSSITVTGTDFSASGLAIDATADFSNTTAIDASIDKIRTALNTVRAQASSFGTSLTVLQTRQDFTNATINTLKEGSDKLTLADTNEEAAKLLSLQTSQQLGITSLSLASQAQQAVLRLF
jgi:flagellin-like hook-associated protein FlgL